LGLRPKDFDVATSATPEQVKGLFRRAFIIATLHRARILWPRPRVEMIEVHLPRLPSICRRRSGQGNERTSKLLAGMTHGGC
jgi:poly(A) polymerase